MCDKERQYVPTYKIIKEHVPFLPSDCLLFPFDVLISTPSRQQTCGHSKDRELSKEGQGGIVTA